MSAGQPQHGRAGGRGRRYLHEVRGQARSHQRPAPTKSPLPNYSALTLSV